MFFIELMLLALLLEMAIGWPARLFTVIKHPVVWMGCLISYLDHRLNKTTLSATRQYTQGVLTTLIVTGTSVSAAACINYSLSNNIIGLAIEAVVASSLLASRSLYQHVNAVARPLLKHDLPQARKSLSHIVGRDTTLLDESNISAAAIESLAENSSDGVYAPLFWGLILGLPGIAGYKAINTLDSMIGHRTPQYLAFGRFAAKLDDMVNLAPARLSAALIAVVGGCLPLFTAINRDAKKHRSPNAGWPEGAMAQALKVRLSGPRTYDNEISDEPWLNPTGAAPQAIDVKRALRVYLLSLALTVGLLILYVLTLGTTDFLL